MSKALPYFTHAHTIQSRMLRPSVCFSTTALGVSRVICVPSCVPQVPAPPLHYPQGNTATPPNLPAACPMTSGSQEPPILNPKWSSATFSASSALHPCQNSISRGFRVHKWIGNNLKCIMNVLHQEDVGYLKILEQAAPSVKCSVFLPKSTRNACTFWVMLFLHWMLWW